MLPEPASQAKERFLGIVMLDTRFPRPPGDVGHPQTFPWPVRKRIVRGAVPREVVTSAQALRGSALLPHFMQAMRELQSAGAKAITTSCGFLVLLQDELQAAVGVPVHVPVVSSSLLHLPALLREEQRVGVLTIDARQLGPVHLVAAGVPEDRLGDVVVQGVDPAGEFATAILGNRLEMDLHLAGQDVVAAAVQLKQRAPDVRSLVLECTNMPPYAAAVRKVTGLRVLSLRELLAPYFSLPIT